MKVFHHPTAITDLPHGAGEDFSYGNEGDKEFEDDEYEEGTCIGSEGGGEGHSTAGNLPS